MRKISAILIITVLAFGSCRKDKIEVIVPITEEQCDCEPLPSDPPFGFEFVYDSTYYSYPAFNPNNDDEILYVDQNNASGQYQLYLFNLQSQNKTLIFEGIITNPPRWAENNWIVLSLADNNIWKIKSTGDSLTQLTNGNNWFSPHVNSSGDKFLCYKAFEEYQFSAIYDLNGVILDTFTWTTHAIGTWKHPTYFLGVDNSHIALIDPYQNQIVNDVTGVWATSINYTSENTAIFSNSTGIYALDLTTMNYSRLACACASRQYHFGTVNSDYSKIIFTRVDLTPLGANTLHVDRKLVMMNIDGSQEAEILIP